MLVPPISGDSKFIALLKTVRTWFESKID